MAELACPQCGNPCAAEHKFCAGCGFPVGEIVRKAGDDPLIGATLPGGYILQEVVGNGAMGRVYRAQQRALGRSVAVKVVHPHLVGDEGVAARFIREARAASRLNHPNSVAVIDFGMNGVQPYLVMEFLRGRDLGKVMEDEGPLPLKRIGDVMVQVLSGLAEAHALWIVHRDLKPENIVLEPMRQGGDFVKVVDFGLAKMKAELGRDISVTGMLCGTPDYVSPEQVRGGTADARSDLYACGVILYRLLAGRLPFIAESAMEVVRMHVEVPAPSPAEVAPQRNLSPALVEVTLKALEKDPDRRYQSAEELSEALQAAFTAPAPPVVSQRAAARSLLDATCAECSSKIPAGQKFCGDCGARAPESRRPAMVAKDPVIRDRPQAPSNLPLVFTARERDLEWLESCRRKSGGHIGCARVVGEHGVGKTRLVDEFLAGVMSRHVVVRTAADPWSAGVGYHALGRAIAGLAGLPLDGGGPDAWADAGPEARRGLAEVFARRARTSGSGRHDAISPEGRRFGAAKALRWAMQRALAGAGGRGVILVIEDLDAVDGASRNALVDVTSEAVDGAMLFVATHLPGIDSAWRGSSTVLRGLPTSYVGALLRGVAPDRATSGPESRVVPPLYIDQLVRFTLERGGEPPPRVADLVAVRIERLPSSARRVLQLVALMGDLADRPFLAALLPDVPDLDAQVEVLVIAGLVQERRPHGATGAAPTLVVTHPLLREVTLAGIPAWVRRDLHSCLVSGEGGKWAQLPIEVQAQHSYQAQESYEALMLLEQCADLAASRADTLGCIAALKRGLDLARREVFRGELDDPTGSVLIFSQKLADALGRVGDREGASAVMKDALALMGPSSSSRPRTAGT